jgi:hypothetical protein
MNAHPKFSTNSLTAKLLKLLAKLRPYRLASFLLFVALLYGSVFLHINSLSNAQPSDNAVKSQIKTSKLSHIDPAVVRKIQSLQDHSVNVQSLFNQVRQNPFQCQTPSQCSAKRPAN